MSFLLFAALASGAAAILLALGACVHVPRRRRSRLITSLNLGATTMSNALVGTPKKFTITPKDALGLTVDLAKFPTALTEVVWSVSNTDIAAVNTTKADGTEAEVLFSSDGTVSLTVTGKDKDGTSLSESLDVTAEFPVPKVASLNLAEA